MAGLRRGWALLADIQNLKAAGGKSYSHPIVLFGWRKKP